MLVMMAVLTLAAAIAGRYPFGGPPRHQFFLFPFAILSAIVALDRIETAMLPAGWPRRVFIPAVVAGCVASIVSWMVLFNITRTPPFQRETSEFRMLFPNARAVYVAQYTLIPFFIHHHEWDWRLERRGNAHPDFGVWKLSKDGQELRVCRDFYRWWLDVSERELYSNLHRCLDSTGASQVAIFQLGQNGLPEGSRTDEASRMIDKLATNAGLRSTSTVITADSVFAGFERDPASLLKSSKALR